MVMFVLGVGWVIYQFNSEWSKEPQVQIEYWGLSLGSSKSDVKFMKGEPKEINEGKMGESWEFTDGVGESIFRVDFVDNSIARVMRIGQDGGFYRSIQGILPGYSNLETILEKLGDPSNISISEDKSSSIYNFDEYNLFFGLTKNKVNILGIYDPRTGPIRLASEKE